MIHFLLAILASFIGSFVALLIWIHFHLEDKWRKRQQRYKAKRGREGSDLATVTDVARLANGNLGDVLAPKDP